MNVSQVAIEIIFLEDRSLFLMKKRVYFQYSPNFQAGGSNLGIGGATVPLRARIKRVNLRDMIFYLEQERDTCRSSMLYKSYLK